ncbi:MAG: hypothetical protein IKM80_00605, partial [Bacilli bacterium]|nr:hypothetical protein [Bacilli bacterium]
MKWALFVFAFVAPLLINGAFFLVRFLKRKEEKFSFKNPLVQEELINLGASVLLTLIAGLVGLTSSEVKPMNIFVGYLFISLLAREITPLIKLNWKGLGRESAAPIAKAAIAL